MMLTPATAMADPALLASHFPGESWGRWRAVLKAAYAERLTADEAALFREVAERDAPLRRVRELWVIAGRRSGKDSIASAVATIAAVNDYSGHLRPGERATIMCLASDRAQARIILRYIKGNFSTVPMFSPFVARETEEAIELSNGVEVIVSTNSYRAVRGRAIVCAIFDECAFWRDEASATPDVETYNAIEPSLATLPGAMLIGISSPYRKSGLLYSKWRDAYGKNDDDVLVVKGATRLFNPTVPQSLIDRAIVRDPEAAGAEWLAEWRSDIADFIGREIVEGLIADGVRERDPEQGIRYVAFVDPSGGSSDSMTLAIAHADGDRAVILDLIREIRAPFSPESAVTEFAETLKRFGLRTVKGDRYAGEWPRERFREHGITYEIADRSRSELYRDLLPVLNSSGVVLLDNERLVAQLCGLERRTARGGRDSIDHAPGQHDDIANAVAGAVVAAQPARSSFLKMFTPELANRKW